MSKAVKELMTADLKKRFDGIENACVVDLTGLNVKSTEKLRDALCEKSARMQVVKNRLARRAFEGGPLERLGSSLEGPCALVTSPEGIIDVAKTLVEVATEFPELTLKQAIFDGDEDLITVEDLSKMKTRTELLGDVAMLIASPGRAVAGCIQSPQAKIAGCAKTLADKAA